MSKKPAKRLAEIDQREAALAAAERNRRDLLRRVEELQAAREIEPA